MELQEDLAALAARHDELASRLAAREKDKAKNEEIIESKVTYLHLSSIDQSRHPVEYICARWLKTDGWMNGLENIEPWLNTTFMTAVLYAYVRCQPYTVLAV